MAPAIRVPVLQSAKPAFRKGAGFSIFEKV